MLDDYLLQGSTEKVELELEEPVLRVLKTMEGYRSISVSELANTALKRFIAQHSDFLPPERSPPSSQSSRSLQ